MRSKVSACLLAALSLGGCSTATPVADDAASSGWVVELYRAGAQRPLSMGCAEPVDLSGYENGSFARIAEPHGRRVKYIVAHVAPGLALKEGDHVDIAPSRCVKGKLPEVRKVSD